MWRQAYLNARGVVDGSIDPDEYVTSTVHTVAKTKVCCRTPPSMHPHTLMSDTVH